jgi:hypothetical protein
MSFFGVLLARILTGKKQSSDGVRLVNPKLVDQTVLRPPSVSPPPITEIVTRPDQQYNRPTTSINIERLFK